MSQTQNCLLLLHAVLDSRPPSNHRNVVKSFSHYTERLGRGVPLIMLFTRSAC